MKRLAIACLLAGGCIRAPDIVLIDRATALEREAAGEFPKLELELARAGASARPPALSREQLESAGHARPVAGEDESSDAERVDALLRATCIGEASDGALVETRERCTVKEVPHMGSLLEKHNRDRMQIWEWLRSKRPERSLVEVRKAWRAVHLRSVVCGGQVQRDDGVWDVKKC